MGAWVRVYEVGQWQKIAPRCHFFSKDEQVDILDDHSHTRSRSTTYNTRN